MDYVNLYCRAHTVREISRGNSDYS